MKYVLALLGEVIVELINVSADATLQYYVPTRRTLTTTHQIIWARALSVALKLIVTALKKH